MKKIEIVAGISDSKNIVERLQRRGVLELTDIDDENFVKYKTSSVVSQLERNLSNVKTALDILKIHCDIKKPPLDFLNGRRRITTKQFAVLSDKTDKTLSVCRKILDLNKKISESDKIIANLKTKNDILSAWINLDVPQNYSGSKKTVSYIGTLPYECDKDTIVKMLKAEDEDVLFDILVVSSKKEQTIIFTTANKEYSEKFYDMLRNIGFSRSSSESSLTPSEEIDVNNEKIRELGAKILSFKENIRAYEDKYEDIMFLTDYLTMKKDKYIAVSKLAMTKNTVVICGYIPKKYIDGLVTEFESKYTVAISVFEPDDNEEVPVLLENGKFSEPVEGITKMYALPNKRDVDPSPVMAFFYYLFFGMMLSDAGYGILMILGTGFVLKKFNVEGSLKKSLKMFFYCGFSTLFWGILFGSWFGDLPQVISSDFFGKTITTTALWFEPLNDPIKLLLFSFGLGILHLFLGLAVNFKILWCEGRRLDAICDVIPVYITILGVMPMAASILSTVPDILINIGGKLALVGGLLIILTSGRNGKNIIIKFFGGIYGLYNIATGYLGDILSYSRLLALGLATGSIASVINLIATMPQNTVLKAVMLTVVGIIGHAANLGINLLGAYVHSDRLQFVELFSKFYEGGGRAFEPLKSDTKYIKFEKENIYE